MNRTVKRILHSSILRALAVLSSTFCLAHHQDRITDWGATSIIMGDGNLVKGKDVDNDLLTTTYSISSANPEEQFYFAEWADEGDVLVRGVLFQSNEKLMTAGTIKFYVDNVPCPDTNGVGVNAIGGVFNCDLVGSSFVAFCEDTCTPNLSIVEVQFFQSKILSFEGSFSLFNGNTKKRGNLEKIFNRGTYSDNNWQRQLTIEANGRPQAGACVTLPFRAEATKILVYMNPAGADHYNYKHNLSTLTDLLPTGSTQPLGQRVISVGTPFPGFKSAKGSWFSQTFCTYRGGDIHLAKVLVFGEYCDGKTFFPLTSLAGWAKPATFEPQAPGQTFEFASPVFTWCEYIQDFADLSIEFVDRNQPLPQEPLDWVTLDLATGQIRVEATNKAFVTYAMQTVAIKMKVVTTQFIVNAPKEIDILNVKFENLEAFECQQSQILGPLKIPDGIQVTTFDEEAVLFELGEVVDSGTLILQGYTGFEKATCGPFKIEIKTGIQYVNQDGALKYSVKSDNNALVGKQPVVIEIKATRYENIVAQITGEVEILACQVQQLRPPDDALPFSALQLVFEVPFTELIKLPLFEPYPACGLTNKDVSYTIQDNAPTWTEFSDADRTVALSIEDLELLEQPVSVEVKAVLGKFEENMSFTLRYMDRSQKEIEEPEPEPEPEQETKEDEDEEEQVGKPTEQWDGWKSLLEQQTASLGITLPPPNPDPDYVPTPPKPLLTKVSPRGKTSIEFNEDVFVYENLKNLTFAKSGNEEKAGQRELQTTIRIEDIEQVQFIEIFVEPGETSDPSKLGFEYTMEFVNNRTIELSIQWDNPPFVSANQPEDVLVIKFNGPIYDQQDGMQIELDNKEIRQVIPPQLEPGGLTDAIQGAGDSLQITSATTVLGNFILNILLAGSLNQVWGMVNNLQIVLHSPLINVQFPANAFILYDVMIQVATFDIMPTDDFFPWFFPTLPEDDDPFNDKFDRLQIGSRYMVMNMGTMLIIFTFYAILLLLYPCVRFLRNDAKWAAKFEPQMRSMLFWNHTILFVQEGFLDILLAGTVNLYFINEGTLKWDSGSLVVTNLLSMFLVASCGLLFLVMVVYLWPRFDKLKSKSIKRKFHPIYEMLNLRHGSLTFLWPVFFIVRRVLFVVAVCLLVKYTSLQIILFLYPTIAVMVILCTVKPLEDEPTNRMEIYNSVMILCMTYCLMCFTPFALDARARYTMGYVLVLLTCKNIFVNIYFVARNPMRESYLRCKVRWAKRQKISNKFKLKAQKTKMFFKRQYNRLTGKIVLDEIELEDKDGKQYKLETIYEISNESLDSFEDAERQLETLRKKFNSEKTLNAQTIDELNAEAIRVLELRNEKRIEAQKQQVSETLDRYTFGNQNPKLTKYRMPYIEDLVDTKAWHQKNSFFEKMDGHSKRTLSGLKDKARLLTAEQNSQLIRSLDQDQKLLSGQDPPKREPNRKVLIAEKWLNQLGSTRAPQISNNDDDSVIYSNTGNIQLQITEEKPRPDQNHVVEKATRNSMNPFQLAKSAIVQDDDETTQGRFIDLNRGQQDDVVLGKGRNKTSRNLFEIGQTTKMADGQVVLFPELYTDMYGVKEKDEETETKLESSLCDQSQSMRPPPSLQNKQIAKTVRKEKKERSRQSKRTETSIDVRSTKHSQFEEAKRELRQQVLSQFQTQSMVQSRTPRHDGGKEQKKSGPKARSIAQDSKHTKMLNKQIQDESSSSSDAASKSSSDSSKDSSSDQSSSSSSSSSEEVKSQNMTKHQRRVAQTAQIMGAINKLKSSQAQ